MHSAGVCVCVCVCVGQSKVKLVTAILVATFSFDLRVYLPWSVFTGHSNSCWRPDSTHSNQNELWTGCSICLINVHVHVCNSQITSSNKLMSTSRRNVGAVSMTKELCIIWRWSRRSSLIFPAKWLCVPEGQFSTKRSLTPSSLFKRHPYTTFCLQETHSF